MGRPEEEIPLAEAALVISAHYDPTLDIESQLGRLDSIASRAIAGDTVSVCHVLFEQLGLRGDRDRYDDPLNSCIERVLDRRLGIPISLSVLLIEIARRAGVTLQGIGMPGHFLVRDPATPDVLIDAFDGGRHLDRSACQDLLARVAGPRTPLSAQMLAPVGPRSILTRMLANLDGSFDRRSDRVGLRWVTDMRLAIPELGFGDRFQLATRLAGFGRFDEAAAMLEELSQHPRAGDLASRMRSDALTMRARLN